MAVKKNHCNTSPCRVATCIRDGWPAQFTNAGPEYYFSTPLLCETNTSPGLFYYTVHSDTHTVHNAHQGLCAHTHISHSHLACMARFRTFCHLATCMYPWASTVHSLCTVQSYCEESTLYQLNYRSYSSSYT